MDKVEFVKENIKVMEIIKNRLSNEDATLFNLTVSGSHLYGFDSEDSDVDYRGMFIVDSNKLLGLYGLDEVVEIRFDDKDIVLFEIKKEINLALKGNCNVLEHINAPQVFNTARFLEMKQAINNSFGKTGLYNSYKGLATFNYKKFILGGKSNAKKYLYVLRGLMAGIHVLRTGRIEPNIQKLNIHFNIPEVNKLVAMKMAGDELEEIPKDLMDGSIERIISKLLDELDDAFIKSKIPGSPDDKDVRLVNSLLIKIRKENFMQ